MLGLGAVLAVSLLAACTAAGGGGTSSSGTEGDSRLMRPDDLAVSLGFEDVAATTDWDAVRAGLEQVGATSVHLSAGRVEWTAFPWPGHEDAWSAPVADEDGRDFLAEALDAVGDRGVVVTIDALVPRMIAEHPSLAGVTAAGERSELFASASALATGEVGEALVEMAGYLAETYDVEGVTFTELMFDDATFGDDDAALYREMTGEADWPRLPDGGIDTEAEEIGLWRSQVLADLLGRAREAVAGGDVEVAVDVRADWDDPVHGRAESGHDLAVLAPSLDRIVVWNYPGLAGRTGRESELLTRGLVAGGIDPATVTMSVGLWASGAEGGVVDDDADLASSQGSDAVLSPAQMAEAALWSGTHGVTSVAVTPRSLMTPEHWEALAAAWD